MSQNCNCPKKASYQQQCNDFENTNENNQLYENLRSRRASALNQREKAVKLPGAIRIKDYAFEYPDAQNSDLLSLFPIMAQIVSGVEDYEHNILSFWILDVFIEGLRTAQLSGMSQRNQKATLEWMAYVYNVMQGSGSKLTRRDIFVKIKLQVLSPDYNSNDYYSGSNSEESINENKTLQKHESRAWKMPFPAKWTITDNFIDEPKPKVEDEDKDSNSKQNLSDMKIILEIIYHVFARFSTFFLIRTSLQSTPFVEVVDLPIKLNVPKLLLKSDSTSQIKFDKGGKRSSSLKISDEAILFREIKNNDFILPLDMALGVDALKKELFSFTSHDSSLSERERVLQKKK